VVDSGIDFTHPDLTNNEWTNPLASAEGDVHGWDFVVDNGDIKDEQGHGTAVAGIIAAEGNNALGITGRNVARRPDELASFWIIPERVMSAMRLRQSITRLHTAHK
jgi:subtilisin family serine protease